MTRLCAVGFVFVLMVVACKQTEPLAPGATIDPHSAKDPALSAFVRNFNLWSDPGLHHRAEYRSLVASGEHVGPLDAAAESRHLQSLLSPDCVVVIEFEGRRSEQTGAEFVNSIQRGRFTQRAQEGLLDEPEVEISKTEATVRMRKYVIGQRDEDEYAFSSRLTISLEGDGPLITKIVRRYDRPTSEEKKRIPPLGGVGPALTSPLSEEEQVARLRSSNSQIPSEPGTDSEIEALVEQLDGRGENRALAAYYLGNMGSSARAAIPSLTRALKDDDGPVRRAAAEALGKMGPDSKSAIPALREALNDESGDVRLHAQWALERLDA